MFYLRAANPDSLISIGCLPEALVLCLTWNFILLSRTILLSLVLRALGFGTGESEAYFLGRPGESQSSTVIKSDLSRLASLLTRELKRGLASPTIVADFSRYESTSKLKSSSLLELSLSTETMGFCFSLGVAET